MGSKVTCIIVVAIERSSNTIVTFFTYYSRDLFLDLKGAEISSMCLTRLSPLKLQVKWQMESQSHSEVYYEVYLNNNVAVSECHDTNAEIEVEPGTTNSLK